MLRPAAAHCAARATLGASMPNDVSVLVFSRVVRSWAGTATALAGRTIRSCRGAVVTVFGNRLTARHLGRATRQQLPETNEANQGSRGQNPTCENIRQDANSGCAPLRKSSAHKHLENPGESLQTRFLPPTCRKKRSCRSRGRVGRDDRVVGAESADGDDPDHDAHHVGRRRRCPGP